MDEQHDPRLDEALEVLRRSLAQPPGEHVVQRHLAAMRDAALEERPLGWWAGLRERSALGSKPVPGLSPRWLVAGAAALIGFTAGLAAANVLPDPAQNLVAEMASQVGLDLPDPDDHAVGAAGHDGGGEHGPGKGHGPDDDDTGDDDAGDDDGGTGVTGAGEHPDNHGKTVSSVAHDDTLEGCEHGQAVSDVASSKSRGNDDAPGLGDDHDPCDHDDAGDDAGGTTSTSELDEGEGPSANQGPGNAGDQGRHRGRGHHDDGDDD